MGCAHLSAHLGRFVFSSSGSENAKDPPERAFREAGVTGLEPAASGLTVLRSNQLSYTPETSQYADGR